MKIVILCGKYGMGHLSAAIAIKEQLEKDLKNIEVKIDDFIAYAFPGVNKIMYSGFKILTTKTPKFYSRAYQNVASKEHNPIYAQIMLAQLTRYLKEEKPDVIICTLPEIARTVSLYKTKYKSSIPLVTCVTDITTFYEWVNYESNLYLVANDTVKKFLVKYGIKKDSIIISGIPVKQKFHSLQKIKSNKKELLIMGGGLGNIPLDKSFYEKISKHEEIHVNILCAKNVELYKELKGKYDNITAISFSDKVEQYMAKADLVITKSGGISTFECIYAKLPILTYRPFLPQEKLNAEFIESKNMGKIMWENDKDPYELVLKLFQNDETTIMAQNMELQKQQLNLNYSKIVQKLYEYYKDE